MVADSILWCGRIPGITDIVIYCSVCEKVKESFDLVHKQVFEALKKLGLEIIETEGKEFDPNFHDAVMQTPTSEHPEHTIINELQKGYKMGDKVLRPALVNVATAEN